MLICLAAIDTEEDKIKLEQIYKRYNQIMYQAAYRILADSYQAEDVVSQTLFKIIDYLDEIRKLSKARTKAYIITMTENTAIDYYRKRNREQVQDIIKIECFQNSTVDSYGENDVLDAINSLTVNYSTILRLRYSQGYSDKEIAEMLGITQENVRTRVKRAKKKLEGVLRERGVYF